MPQITLRDNKTVEVSSDEAVRIKQEYDEKKDMIEVGGDFIKRTEIRGIGTKFSKSDRYDISDPSQKAVIKAFEIALEGRDADEYAKSLRIINEDGAIVRSRVQEYNDILAKYKALEELRWKRQYAEKMKHQEDNLAMDAKCSDKGDNRCFICFPKTMGELLLERGIKLGSMFSAR